MTMDLCEAMDLCGFEEKEYHLKNITFRNIRIAKNGQKEDGIHQKYCENLVFENISVG